MKETRKVLSIKYLNMFSVPLQMLAVCIERKNTAFLMLEIHIVHLGASIAGFERDDKNQRK